MLNVTNKMGSLVIMRVIKLWSWVQTFLHCKNKVAMSACKAFVITTITWLTLLCKFYECSAGKDSCNGSWYFNNLLVYHKMFYQHCKSSKQIDWERVLTIYWVAAGYVCDWDIQYHLCGRYIYRGVWGLVVVQLSQLSGRVLAAQAPCSIFPQTLHSNAREEF